MITRYATAQDDIRFLQQAQEVAKQSPDPSTKVGAVLTVDTRSFGKGRPLGGVMGPVVIAEGFNSFPRRCCQDPEIYADRERKYLRVVHAEVAAIINARQDPLHGTLYVWPPAQEPTCARCAAVVISAGIRRVVHVIADNEFSARWAREFEESRQMYREAGMEITGVNLHPDLFREYFGG